MKTFRTITFLILLLFASANGVQATIIVAFEGPTEGQTVSGVGLIRGWAFSDRSGVRITQVILSIDGKNIGSIPCCSERPDVRDAFPQYPSDNTLNSGFGLIRNYGVHPNGSHLFTIIIQDSAGGESTFTHTVTTVKTGNSEFLDSFSIGSAQVELEGQELLLSNVQVRDKASQQLRQVATRLRWVSSSQGLSIVDATTLGVLTVPVSTSQAPALIEQSLSTDLQAVLESPSMGSTASGISIIRGWAFPPSGRTIESVQLFVDGNFFQSIPCCSNRQDVADAFPGEANAKNSGFGVTFNYGRLAPGEHTIEVSVKDSSNAPALVLRSQIIVVTPAGFEFLDEFDFSSADFRIDGEELVLRGVKIRSKASHQTSFRILHFQWNIASQNFNLVRDNIDPEQLISDDFEDGEASDWTILSGQWSVSNGEFINASDDPLPKGLAVSGPEVTTFQLTAQIRSTDDDAVGLLFGVQSLEEHYLVEFNVQKNRVQLQKRSGGVLNVLDAAASFSFTRGVAFEAAIRVREKRILAFVNGRVVIDFTDPALASGRVGLFSQVNKFTAFDDVHLATLNTVKLEGGTTIYVDAANAGKVQNGQTEATAWSTITQALNDPRFRDTAGNTILIQGGRYREQVDIFGRMSGIPGAFNTIRAIEGAEVIVDGEKDTPNARREGVLIHTGTSYVRIEGLHIQNAQHRGILVFESGPGEIIGNRIHSCGDSAIEFWYGARNYESVNNVIYQNEQDGIVLSEGSGDDPSRFGSNRAIMIRNNIIYANGPDGGDGIAIRSDRTHSFAIYNNTIVSNSGDGISIDSANCWGDLRNNIIVSNGRIGLKTTPDDLVSRAYNNLFNNGASGTNNFDGRGGQGKNSMNLDPLFINIQAGDFRLHNASPSIDTGDPATSFNDINNTRNDMGVYGGPYLLSGTPLLN